MKHQSRNALGRGSLRPMGGHPLVASELRKPFGEIPLHFNHLLYFFLASAIAIDHFV